MPELKIPGRQIAQPSGPDLTGAIQASGALGNVIAGVSKTAGAIVKNQRELAQASALASAKTDFETAFIKFKNDPNINAESFEQFNAELNAKSQAYISSMPEFDSSFASTLDAYRGDFSNQALNATLKTGLANEVRDLSLTVNDLQSQYGREVGEGNLEKAALTKINIQRAVDALISKGASAKQLNNIIKSTETIGVSAYFNKALQDAGTLSGRTAVMKEMLTLPQTPSNGKAIDVSYKEFNRLNKLYAEAESLSPILDNVVTGNKWANHDADAKDSDKVVNLVANNLATQRQNGSPPSSPALYQEKPAFEGQNKTYDYEEEVNAEREGRAPNRYLVESTKQSMEASSADATLEDLANAHIIVGSKNSTVFPNLVTNMLRAGSGEQMKNAVIAIHKVYNEALETLVLDPQTEVIYTEFRNMLDNGETDLNAMAEKARSFLQKTSQTNLKFNNDVFDNMYSLKSEKGLSALSKAFTNATDASADNTAGGLVDFYHTYKANYLESNGNGATALDMTKRQMTRVHGADRFTADVYTRFPPTKVMSWATEEQINNQFLVQIVGLSKRNPSIKLPDGYKRAETATETERMETSLVHNKAGFEGLPDIRRGGTEDIYITQTVPGVGDVTGRLFVKSNNLTNQNDTGMPVWEAWMKDEMGREYPVVDDTSPYKNTFLLAGLSPKEFAPIYTKEHEKEIFNNRRDEVLAAEGKQLYSLFNFSPVENYQRRQAYMADIENRERVEGKLRKILGTEDGE